MKIIIVGPAWPLRGGIANFNEALCRSLLTQGHDTSIISFKLQYPSILFPGKSQLETDGNTSDLPITPTINSIDPISWYKTAKHIREQNPDLVIIRYWLPFMAPALGTIAGNLKTNKSKTIVIGLTDNIIPHEKRFLDKQLTSYFIKKCDGFVVMSDQVRSDLLTFDNTKPVVKKFHPVYDIFGEVVSKEESSAKLHLPERERVVLFFGFIRKYKGLDILLDAMSYPKVKALNIKLIVAGEFYEDRGPYDEQIKKHGLQDHVVMSGNYIPKEAVKYYFGAADLVVQPYRSATQSGVTQIAYHFGIPMVVTNTGGLPEMVEHGVAGLVCPPNAEKVADCIADFYTNDSLQQKLKTGVVKNKELFSWNEMTDGIFEVYNLVQYKNN